MNTPSLNISETLQLAQQHHQAGRLQQAEQSYLQILEAEPENPDANHLFGILAYQTGKLDSAAQLISQAILKDGNQAPYYNNLGLVLEAQGKPDQAIMLYRQAVSLDENYTEAHLNLGVALESLAKLEEALSAFTQAVKTNPEFASAHNSQGVVLHKLGRLTDATASLQQAITLEPDFAEAHNNLGNTLESQGRIDAALESYRLALTLQPDNARGFSNLLLCMQYDARINPSVLFQAHQEWHTRYGAGLCEKTTTYNNSRDPQKRLRIGYVSADFCRHSVAYFIEPILQSHNREAVEVFCYANVASPDKVTQSIKALADSWINIHGLSDSQVADQIKSDAIDILIDLSGHTAGNRLLVFARKPAPIQMTYLGYPGTSGLAEMDYRLSDNWLDPPTESEPLHSETLIRLEKGSLCFKPPVLPDRTDSLLDNPSNQITFASFNNSAKVSPDVIALWSAILRAVPDSRLLLKSKSLGDEETVQHIKQLFSKHDIAAERLELLSWTASLEEHLILYNRVHIALDTFPYSGCTTSCEALSMNVPVLTLDRNESRSRMSLAILKQAGLDELISYSTAEYINKAVALAKDPVKLKSLRARIRQELPHSSLLDANSITDSIENAYREMWIRWCENG